ncbi:lactonase family protein [Planococcus lenghuensis]|uniref:6-phosphogluconolactonase n=1 Tax=Planococcus lenghuensis TaxID=2213202 RepID=A0A1Q2KVB7_9BACL|nr:lactonase family protein [Planococcus lenghuensis]AQQ52168.1 hypothetical protein B0X71_02920 [Planococcus lenghuensis]
MATSYVLTGSYASKEEAGIKLWQFEESDGTLTELQGIEGVERPSFIAVHPNRMSFVTASETADGELVAFRLYGFENEVSEINRQKTGGDHPAHVCIDEAGEWVLSVNYSGATVNVFPLHGNGSIGEMTDAVIHKGQGPDKERQDAAHPHSVRQIPKTNLFLVADLGTDRIMSYRLDRTNGKLSLVSRNRTAPGAGPRHMAFHPFESIVYALGELDSTLTVYKWDREGVLNNLQAVPLLPADYQGDNTSAEVTVSKDGKFVYASNRGHDSIAAFTVQENGTLTPLAFTASGGAGPRHFTLIPGQPWLIAANEKSDSLAVLRIDPSGVPQPATLAVSTKAPVCVRVVG